MSDTKQSVYRLIAQIPKGKVSTYGQVAKRTGIKSPRLVGRILHQNKNPEKFPCHRVVFSDGSLSKSYTFGGMRRQKEKLMNEEVVFKGNKVDLTVSLFSDFQPVFLSR